MINSTKYSNFLKALLGKTNNNVQTHTEQKESKNETLDFSTGSKDQTEDWNGMVQISTNDKTKKKETPENSANSAVKSSGYQKFLDSLLRKTEPDKTKESADSPTPTVTTPTVTPEPTVAPTETPVPTTEDTPVISEGEIGSVEYIGKLMDIENIADNYDVKTDKQGRVIEISEKSEQKIGDGVIGIARNIHAKTYYISYGDNNEVTIGGPHINGLAGSVPGSKTYNDNGELIRETLPHAVLPYPTGTTVYYENGQVSKTVNEIHNADGTTSTRTEKPNGSWSEVVKDIDGNVISAEGKEILSAPTLSSSIEGPFAHGRGFELFNGMSIFSNADEETEVTYSIDSDGKITINGNNLKINAYTYVFVPSQYGLVTMPKWIKSSEIRLDNLVVNGDNNVVNGSSKEDNVKVIGNNNQVDLGGGDDTANIIGNNNSVKNTENVSMRGKDIPEGEVGTIEYVINLLKLPKPTPTETMELIHNTQMTGYCANEYTIQETDDEGRITKFSLNITKGGLAQVPFTYEVAYDKNGNISEIIEKVGFDGNDGSPLVTKTYNGDGKLIKEKSVSQGIRYPITTEITYGDGITTQVVTIDNPEIGKPLSVETTYTTDSYVSVFKDEYSYDADGNMTQKVYTSVLDDVQLERVTTTYYTNGVEKSKEGEITLRTSSLNVGNRTVDTYYMYPINIRNPKNKNATFTYFWTFDGTEEKLEVNVNDMEILPGSGKEWNVSNVVINGNNNTITGSYNDDEIAVYGNNNRIDLAGGDDKLNIVGYNNTIKNVEEINSTTTPTPEFDPHVMGDE